MAGAAVVWSYPRDRRRISEEPSRAMTQNETESKIRSVLASQGANAIAFETALQAIAGDFDARTCTLHAWNDDRKLLELRASVGLPANIAAIVATVPIGKGMAGICAERRSPVNVCNVQTDASGVVRPGAKETRVQGGLVVPLLRGDRLVGTLGVGSAHDHEYSPEEIERLTAYGAIFVDALIGTR
jgi:L-methionine (R)-S-oxide reductase